MKTLLILIGTIFLCNQLLAQTGAKGDAFKELSKETGKTHVIIIGASDYTYFPKLNYSDDDAILMESYLSNFDNTTIKTFINKTALSKDSIGVEIDMTLNNEAEPGDKVIIYFSGHGDVDPKYNDGFLILPNAQLPSARTYRYNSALSMAELDEMMGLAAKRGVNVLLITDACKSGSILNARDANQRMLEIGDNSVSIVSCGPSESSFESKDLENGLFTFYLIQGLKGLADQNNDLSVTYLELYTYLVTNVGVDAKRINGESQTPGIRAGIITDKVSKVDPSMLAEAKTKQKEIEKKQFNSNGSQDVASAGKVGKGWTSTTKMNSTSEYLLGLMRTLVFKGTIFHDEIDNQESSEITAGASSMISVSSSPVYSISTSSNGNFIAAPSNNDVAIYGKEMNLIRKLKGHKGGVTSVAFRPGTNELVTGSWDNTVILWDADKGTKLNSLPKISDEAYGLCFLDQNQVLIGTNKGDLYNWDLVSGQSKMMNLGRSRIAAVELAGDLVYAAMGDGTIRVVDPKSMKQVTTITAHKGGVNGLCFNTLKNEMLSVGDDKELKIWNVTTNQIVKSIALDFYDNRDVDVDPFGSFAFISSRRYDLDVIDLNSGNAYNHFFSSHSSGLVAVHFNQSTGDVLIGDSKGRIHKNGINIDRTEYAALDIYDLLLKTEGASSFKYRFDATIVNGLNNFVYNVLNPLVNGEAVLPNIEDVLKANRYAKKALELGGVLPLEKRKYEINVLLLEVFEVLLTKNENQYEDALNKVKRIETLDPNGAYALNISGVLLSRLDKLNEAKGKASKAEELAPLWAEAPCGTGKILFQEGDYLNAEVKFKETIEKGPELSKGYYNLAKLYNYTGRITEAKNLIEKASKIDDEVIDIALIEIENAFLLGDYQSVKQIANKTFMDNTIEGIVAKTDVEFLERGANTQYATLYERYSKAYEMDSTNIVAINGLAYFYIRIMDDEKASKFVESTFANEVDGRKIKGETLLKRECKRLFNKAEAIDKRNLTTTIGDWMTRGSELTPETVNGAISRHKQSVEVYAAIGRYYIYKKDFKNALKYLKLGLKADKENMKVNILYLEANKLAGKEKKNASVISALSSNPKQTDVIKYRKELTSYFLLY